MLDLSDPLADWHPPTRTQLMTFSPSGRWVLGQHRTSNRYVVLDSDTGAERAGFELPEGTTAAQIMWESDRAVLLVVREHRRRRSSARH